MLFGLKVTSSQLLMYVSMSNMSSPYHHDEAETLCVGVLINAVMPNWLITVLLVIVLAWLTYKTVLKGIQLHKSEQEAQNGFPIMGSNAHADEPPEQRSASSKSATAHSPAPVTSDSDATCVIHITSPEPATSEAVNTVNLMDQQQHLHNHDGHQPEGDAYSSQIPQQDGGMEQPASDQSENTQPLHLCMCIPWQVVQFAELTLLWSAFLALQYGKVTYSQCSWQFAVLFLAQGIFSLCATAAFMYQSRVLRSSRQTQLQQPLLEDRKQITSHHDWTTLVLVKCVGTTVVGGTIAGMLGFGGGMILNPLMLEMGIHPLVSSATSSVMVLFSASTATFAFAVNDRLNYQYAAVYGGVCAVASLFGVAVISTSVRRSGKGSLVVFILSMIIGTGALLQAVFGGIAVIQDVKNGRHLSFSSWC